MMHAHLWGREQAIHHLLNKSLRSLPWQQTTILRTRNQISFFVSSPSCTMVREAKSWSSASYCRFHATQVPTRERDTHTHTWTHTKTLTKRRRLEASAQRKHYYWQTDSLSFFFGQKTFFSFFESPDNREQKREREREANLPQWQNKTQQEEPKKKQNPV